MSDTHTKNHDAASAHATHKDNIDAAKSLMHSDKPLTPQMVSSLMHVDVLLDLPSVHGVRHQDQKRQRRGDGEYGGYYVFGVVVVAVIFSVLLGIVLLGASEGIF